MPASIATTLQRCSPQLVAIVGGSGSGKSWLAEKLQATLGKEAARLSLDDFYRDRSHLPPARRSGVNFDHPRPIDWAALEQVLQELKAGQPARVFRYDFSTHCRLQGATVVEPRPLILIEGLWLLHRPGLRRLFAWRVFLDCPAHLRLRRRLARDLLNRGRSRASVLEQFRTTVEPMHRRFVAPQMRWADMVLRHDFSPEHLEQLTEQLRCFLNQQEPPLAPANPDLALVCAGTSATAKVELQLSGKAKSLS